MSTPISTANHSTFTACLSAVESSLGWTPAKDFEVRYLTARIEEKGEIFMEVTPQGMLYIGQTADGFSPFFRPIEK